MSARTIVERVIPASDLPQYVGWSLNGAERRDGVPAWGVLTSAEIVPDGVSIVHPRNVKGPRGWQSAPDGGIIALSVPDFSGPSPYRPHMLTVSHGADVETAGDPHPSTCELCNGPAFWEHSRAWAALRDPETADAYASWYLSQYPDGGTAHPNAYPRFRAERAQ